MRKPIPVLKEALFCFIRKHISVLLKKHIPVLEKGHHIPVLEKEHIPLLEKNHIPVQEVTIRFLLMSLYLLHFVTFYFWLCYILFTIIPLQKYKS